MNMDFFTYVGIVVVVCAVPALIRLLISNICESAEDAEKKKFDRVYSKIDLTSRQLRGYTDSRIAKLEKKLLEKK